MRILVDSQEMKQCDACTMEYFKMPSMVLMERAALSVVEEIEKRKIDTEKCLVVCGLGNNGGDGLAIARMLFLKGCDVTVVCDMAEEKATEQAKAQYAILKQYQIPVIPNLSSLSEADRTSYTLIVDAIFGVGLSRAIQGFWKSEIEVLNEMTGFKLAVDIPSGVNGDDGQIMGCAFRADLTVTFAYAKKGLLLYPGYRYAGKLVVTDIGIEAHSWRDRKPAAFAYEETDLQLLPKRKAHSNKGTYGRVLVIAGKHNMAGAAFFSSKAAAVTGCGLVKILTEECNRTIIQQLFPEGILDTWIRAEIEDNSFFSKLKQCLDWADAVVLGPGLGTGAEAARIVTAVLQMAVSPVIIDADALNILAKEPQALKEFRGEAIVTPHLGEMARLSGNSVEEIKQNIITVAGTFAKEYNVVCVLKDARTITALPDGVHYINTSGNQGMATAGSGDVLTGIIAGLIAQGMHVYEAASFGAYLHGMAGDIMVEETGYYSMLATDIIEGIKRITRKE